MNKKGGSALVAVMILVLLAAIVFGGIYILKIKSEKQVAETQTTTSAPVESTLPAAPSVPAATSTGSAMAVKANNCDDDMACLIAAATKCQAISAVMSYSAPALFSSQMIESGQNKYEIKPSQDPSSCTLTTTILSASFSISNSDRQILISGGPGSKFPPVTDAQIDSGLKQADSGITKVLNVPTFCRGSSATVVAYLADVEKHTPGDSMSFATEMLSTSGGTMTLKTSSGQKLTCSLK